MHCATTCWKFDWLTCLTFLLSLCPPVCLSVHQSVCLSISLSVHQFVCPSVCLSVCLSISLFACPSVLSVSLSISLLSVRPYICPSVSVYRSVLSTNHLPLLHAFQSLTVNRVDGDPVLSCSGKLHESNTTPSALLG